MGQLRRENKDKTTWKPCNSDRVCSDHFVDGEPTVTHPFPELKLGYKKQIPQPRRKIFKHPFPLKEAKKHRCRNRSNISIYNPTRRKPRATHPEFPSEHQYCLSPGREKMRRLRL